MTLGLLAASAFAADLPRKSPEFAVQLDNGMRVRVSDYKGKVLCLVFILTT
jgi:hypothetical protein